jgi:hypothetical protein
MKARKLNPVALLWKNLDKMRILRDFEVGCVVYLYALVLNLRFGGGITLDHGDCNRQEAHDSIRSS